MALVLPEDDLALPEVHRRAQLVIARFRDAIRPIYRSGRGTAPEHIGSCTLIRVGNTRLIVTAAHIIDQRERELWVAGMRKLTPLVGMFSGTWAPGNDRGLDKFDFSVSSVDEELSEGLGNVSYIPSELFSKGRRQDKQRAMYACIGFPNSQNQVRREVSVRMWSHTGPGSSTHEGLGSWALHTPAHLFVKFDKYAKTPEGTKRSSTEPRGISGGPVFYLGDFGDPETYRAAANFQPMLEGIVIERHRRAKVLVAIKITAIIEAIRRAGHVGIE